MTKILFTPFRIISGILAGAVAKKTFERLWGLFDHEAAPESDQRGVPWKKLIAALVLQGAIFRVVRGLIDRSSREMFSRATGTWPGKQRRQSIDA
jgi:hypothetical protein